MSFLVLERVPGFSEKRKNTGERLAKRYSGGTFRYKPKIKDAGLVNKSTAGEGRPRGRLKRRHPIEAVFRASANVNRTSQRDRKRGQGRDRRRASEKKGLRDFQGSHGS